MALFTVSWTIQLDANDAEDAVRQAVQILADPNSTATDFEAINEDEQCEVEHVDSRTL